MLGSIHGHYHQQDRVDVTMALKMMRTEAKFATNEIIESGIV